MNHYQAENVRLKTLWATGQWRNEPPFPRQGSTADRARLRFVDEMASSLLIVAWVDGRITWRWLWRVVSDHAGDFDEQLKALSRAT